MKIGSLFDGSGGFPLAGVICGMEPVWASEIEPYPLRVTAARFPHMTQLGDVTKINGAEIEPVDVITFGSPCQDLSVAGKQAGIHDGARSSLFFEAVRIIKEMRANDAASGRPDELCRPQFAVWENVPGAYSSNKGADFQAVLQAFCDVRGNDVHVPMPEKGKWKKAGCIVGDGWSIAWRTYDAQYWGVPQRRKRIYLVADFGSERAGEVLFESESLRGDSSQGGTPWQRASSDAEGSADGGCGGLVYCLQGNGIDRADTAGCNGRGWRTDASYTLNTLDRPAVALPINMMVATRCEKDDLRTCFGVGKLGDPQFTISAAHEHAVAYPTIALTLPAEHDESLCIDRGKDATDLVVEKGRRYIVRRLTPLECCRLQGFPDWWEDGVEGSDSARYKMWGNGIALPCAVDVLWRIANA